MATDLISVRQAIVAAGAKWVADQTAVSGATSRTRLLGLRMPAQSEAVLRAAIVQSRSFLPAAPPKVDWRNARGGNRVSEVRNQAACGSCVAFAICATAESRLSILKNQPASWLDLSEAHLFFCGCSECCEEGWDFPSALEHARMVGIGLESDMPYAPPQPCRQITPVVKIPEWTSHLADNDRKDAIATLGPVLAAVQVYEDLLYYKSGVYRHVIGDELGLHAVSVVGYDNDEACWIIKNSWSKDFGEDGFVRIGYHELETDRYPFISIDVVSV